VSLVAAALCVLLPWALDPGRVPPRVPAEGPLPAVTYIALDGTWQLQRTDAEGPAGLGDAWTDVPVPSQLIWQDPPYAWYRVEVSVPADWADGHVFLEFGAVRYVAEVYVNRRPVGGHYGGWESFEVDVTDVCTFGGTDELLVRVQDVRAVIRDHVSPAAGNPVEQADAAIMAPVGSQPNLFGIWQSVQLRYRRDVYIDNVRVVTSVRENRIDVTYMLANLDARDRRVKLSAAVMDGADVALDVGSIRVTVPAGDTVEAVLTRPWSEARLWAPESPHLYVLETSLDDAVGELDRDRTRFGFREFWTEGTELVLNGSPVTFLATAGHPPWGGDLLTDAQIRTRYQQIRDLGCVAFRLHANVWPDNWYQVADEMGMLIILESAIWCDSYNYALGDEAFWRNAEDHWRGIVDDHENHPSVVMYSIENEILHCLGFRDMEQVFGSGFTFEVAERRLGDLGRFVRALDPTRPIMYDGDEDPDGAADVANLHYPYEYPRHVDYPNAARWLDAPAPVEGWPRRLWEWDRTKPLYMGEFLWMSEPSMHAYTGLLGDRAYVGSLADSMLAAKAVAWEYQVEAYRNAGLAGMCPWTVWESGGFPNPQSQATRRFYEPNAAFVLEYDCRFFAGESVDRTVVLHNDTCRSAELSLQWYVGGALQGSADFPLGPSGMVRTTLTLTMPEVTTVTDVDFELVVLNGSATVYSRTRSYQVFPLPAGELDLASGTRVALFRGDGAALAFLRGAGIEPLILDDLARTPDVDAGVVIVGAHALDAYELGGVPMVAGGPAAALLDYLRQGGALLVLEQDAIPSGLLPVQTHDAAITMGFIREPGHPVLQGLREDSFRFWRGDHLVAGHTIARPDQGGFRVLVDAGGPNGLEHVLLLELLHGDGCCVMSQLPLTGKLGREPLAGLTLARLIEYAAADPDPRTTVGVVDADGSIPADLSALGVDYVDLTGRLGGADLSSRQLLMLDAASPEVAEHQTRLQSFVRAGGRVLLHGADPGSIKALSGTLPRDLTVVPSLHAPVLHADLTDEVTAGMTNEDLHWVGEFAPRWDQAHRLATDVLTGAVGRAAPPEGQWTVYECEDMVLPEPLVGAVDAGSVLFWRNAALRTDIELPRAGTYHFGVVGRGTPALGAYPSVSIYLDGRALGALTLGPEATAYSIVAAADPGTHSLRLAFTNDAWNPEAGEDRNVWLDRFFFARAKTGTEVALLRPAGLVKVPDGAGFWVIDQVNWDDRIGVEAPAARYLLGLLENLGARFRTRSSITLPAAELQEISPCAWYARDGGVLSVGAVGRFGTDVDFARSGTYEVVMEARGSDALGEYSIADCILDGEVVGSRPFGNDNWTQVVFTVTVDAGVHQVGLGFANDATDPATGDDRNIWLRSITIRSAESMGSPAP
jgi:hypothetical protein